jgi:hypothetical protein
MALIDQAIQLPLGSEFDYSRLTFEQHSILSLLEGLPPRFMDCIDHYEAICETSQHAKSELSGDFIPGNPNSTKYDRELLASFVNRLSGKPDSTKQDEYIARERLSEESGLKNDAEAVIRMFGDELTTRLTETINLGPHKYGDHLYFLEQDPRQKQFPGRKNFMRVDRGAPRPIEFGKQVNPNDIQEPFKRANPADIVMLVRDLQKYVQPK